MAIIYLLPVLLPEVNLPTLPDSKEAFLRAEEKSGFTWHFSTQGLPEILITKYSRELLPHVFTLAFPAVKQRKVVIFCGTFCFAYWRTRLFTGVLPYAVRTFLPSEN